MLRRNCQQAIIDIACLENSNKMKQNCHQVNTHQNSNQASPENLLFTMPHVNSDMDTDTGIKRMTTWSKNATTHPGLMAQDALRVNQKKEDIDKERKLKNAQKEANRKKKAADEAQQAAGEDYIIQLKADEAAAANVDKEFPRKRPVTKGQFDNC